MWLRARSASGLNKEDALTSTIAYAVGEETIVSEEPVTELAPDTDDTPEVAADAPAEPSDAQDAAEAAPDEAGSTDKDTLDVPAFMWLATAAQAQLQALADMPLSELNADEEGRIRFARMHRRHRRDARAAVPAFMYAELASSTPWLSRQRTPSAAELRSAYAGFEVWCQHVYARLKQQMASSATQSQPQTQQGGAPAAAAAQTGQIPVATVASADGPNAGGYL